MQFDKDQILQLLRSNGQHAQADQAGEQLPDQVDTEQHGIDVQELIQKFGGRLGGLL